MVHHGVPRWVPRRWDGASLPSPSGGLLPCTSVKPDTGSSRPKSSGCGPCSESLGPPHTSVQKVGMGHRPQDTSARLSPCPSSRARQLVWKYRLGAGLRTNETQSL